MRNGFIGTARSHGNENQQELTSYFQLNQIRYYSSSGHLQVNKKVYTKHILLPTNSKLEFIYFVKYFW